MAAAASHKCGACKADGTKCQRKVKGSGKGRCSVHKGKRVCKTGAKKKKVGAAGKKKPTAKTLKARRTAAARGCKTQRTFKYATRLSPPKPANNCRGQLAHGNDGKTYRSVSASNGVYRWVKV